MAKYYEGKYDYELLKDIDWGGDSKVTGGLPLKGEYVQRLIKDKFGDKVGYVGQSGDFVLAFATEADYETYLELIATGDPDDKEKAEALVISSWQGIKPNVISVTMEYPVTAQETLLYGTKDINLIFSFDTQDQSGNHSIDEQATVVVTIKKQSTTIGTISGVYSQLKNIKINLDSYLRAGANEVFLNITGNDSKAVANRSFTFTLVQMDFADDFDISNRINPSESSILQIPFRVNAPSMAVSLEFVIDGDVEHKHIESKTSPTGTLDQARIDISRLDEGTHTIQMAAKCMVGNDIFASDVHYKEFVVSRDIESIPYITISNTIPSIYGEEPHYVEKEGDIVLYGVEQYASTIINFACYCYNRETTKIAIFLNNSETPETEMEAKNGSVISYQMFPTAYSESNTIKIIAYGLDGETIEDERIIGPFTIAQTTMDVEDTTTNLMLSLSARGRNNKEPLDKRTQWNYGDYTGTLSNFEWTDISGWDSINNKLIIGAGNQVEINYAPFANPKTITDQGFTFILEFATDNVSNDDAVICDMMKDDIGLKITASEIYFNFTSGKKAVSAKFKSGELNRVALVIREKRGDKYNPLICLYVNGIISAAYQYTIESLQRVDKFISFIGTEEAEAQIKAIKVFNYAFQSDEIVNDYILSRDILYDVRDANGNITDRGMLSLYETNKIYASGSKYTDESTIEYDIDSISNTIPVMFFTGRYEQEKDKATLPDGITSLHSLEDENKSKDKWFFVDVLYKNNAHPELNFYAERARIKIQGTSSLNYTKKNYKLSTNSSKSWATSENKVWTGATCEEKNIENLCVGGAFSFKKGKTDSDSLLDPGVGLKPAYPVATYVLKADCSDSSSAHNTGVARMWNELFKNFTIGNERVGMTKAQKLAEQYNYPYDVRTCVDGYPIVLFYRENTSSNWEFIGKYNFNNDKGTPETYGFEGGKGGIFDTISDKIHAFELLDSADDYALGIGNMDNFLNYTEDEGTHIIQYDWMKGFESRYPEQPDNEWSDSKQMNKIKYFVENENGVEELRKFYVWLASTRYDNDALIEPGKKLTIISYNEHCPEHETYKTVQTLDDNKENRKLKFKIEKWDHFDIYKMAAYYDYLMRYGAVDQVVKNAIFMTDGNEWEDYTRPYQWYYINYDNDTVLGSRNDGRLVYDPYIERKSASQEEGEGEETQTYAFAGDKSVIWNQLNDDEDFLGIYRTVDNALTVAGLSYDQMCYYFNTLQSEKWPERVYNRDQYYKYISAYYAKGIPNDIPLLQGSRVAHRKWWVSRRFALYDSRYISGDYANNLVSFKIDEKQKNYLEYYERYRDGYINIHVTPGANISFGWYINTAGNPVYNTGLGTDKLPFTITVPASALTVGNYVKIFAPESMAEFDMSEALYALTSLDDADKFTNAKTGTCLKVLKLGDTEKALRLKESSIPSEVEEYQMCISHNTGLTAVNLNGCPMLEYLDLYGTQYIGTIDLKEQKYLKTFRGFGLGATAISFANGCPLEKAEISTNCLTLTLDGLNKLKPENVLFEDNRTRVNNLTIRDCQYLSNDYNFVFDWYNKKQAANDNCSLTLDGFMWGSSTKGLDSDEINKLIALGKIRNLDLNGTIYLQSTMTSVQYQQLVQLFGEDSFNYEKNTKLKLRLNGLAVYLTTNDIVSYEGNTYSIETSIIGSNKIEITKKEFTITNTYDKDKVTTLGTLDTIDKTTGDITLKESGITRNVQITCSLNIRNIETEKTGSTFGYVVMYVEPKVYPENVEIIPASVSETALTDSSRIYRFGYEVSPDIKNALQRGDYSITWGLIDSNENLGEDAPMQFSDIVEITDPSADICELRVDDISAVIKGMLKATITMNTVNPEFTPAIPVTSTTIGLIVKSPDSLISQYENSVMYELCLAAGITRGEGYTMTYEEARTVDNEGIARLVALCSGNANITEFNAFREFTSVTVIPEGLFEDCANLESIILPINIEEIKPRAFKNCSKLKSKHIETEDDYSKEGITLRNLEKLRIIGAEAFYGCEKLENAEFFKNDESVGGNYNITELQDLAFAASGVKYATLPKDLLMCGNEVFAGCKSLTGYSIDMQSLAPPQGKEIPEGLFKGCISIPEIVIPSWVEIIRSNAFEGCRNATRIEFPNSLPLIEENAFANINNVSKIELGTLGTAYNIHEALQPTYGMLVEVEMLKAMKQTPSQLSYLLGYQGRDCNIIHCYVKDNDYETIKDMQDAVSVNGKGYYSTNGHLYYYDGTNLILVRYYAPGIIDSFELPTGVTVHLMSYCMANVEFTDITFPYNTIPYNHNDYTLTYLEGNSLKISNSTTAFSHYDFAYTTLSKGLILCENETILQNVFDEFNGNLYLDSIGENFKIENDFVGSHAFNGGRYCLYVKSKDFDKIIDELKNTSNPRYDFVKISDIPASGNINVIKTKTDGEGHQTIEFDNSSIITIGSLSDENHINTVNIYDASYKYHSTTAATDNHIYIDDESVTEITGKLTEILIPEDEISIIDFSKERTNYDCIVVNKPINGNKWKYNPILRGLFMATPYRTWNDNGYVVLDLPENFIGKTFHILYHYEARNISRYDPDLAIIYSGLTSESPDSYHELLKMGAQVVNPSEYTGETYTSEVKNYDSYNVLTFTDWPANARLKIEYRPAALWREETPQLNPVGIDGIVIRAIYLDGYELAYPDVSTQEWPYFNDDESVSREKKENTIGLAHYDIDTDETEVVVFGLPSKTYEIGEEACLSYWNKLGYENGEYATEEDLLLIKNGTSFTDVDTKFTTDPEATDKPLLPKVVLVFNNRNKNEVQNG